jgi:hypothetical protein
VKKIYDTPGYSINSLLGRINLGKYLANMNMNEQMRDLWFRGLEEN